MNVKSLLHRIWRRSFRHLPPSTDEIQYFAPEDIDHLAQVYAESGVIKGGPWEQYRHAHMALPAWFVPGLDPWGPAYRAQQVRLWQMVCGIDRDYDPSKDEQEFAWGEVDPVRQPGYYVRRDPAAIAAAADHWLATGMLLKHAGLNAGDHALEYGAGFAQSALALARLGVVVDTVDISATFCGYVTAQAEFFRVPLTAHHAPFGFNPHPDRKYDLIWFYESFHHCLDFAAVVPRIAQMLAPGGRVILGGEPIVEKEYAAVPYPWGVRLHSEVAVVMRQTRWFELGFSEAFLYQIFERSGLRGRRVECPPSDFGRLYVFERVEKT